MAARSKPALGDANDEPDGVRTLRLRIKDKHATHLRELAREYKVCTQMGNQGHAGQVIPTPACVPAETRLIGGFLLCETSMR